MARWVVCSTPDCGELHQGSGKCPDCRHAADKARGTRQQRGYDRDHQVVRAALLPSAYGTPCPLCGRTMKPGEALDLDHSVPLAQDPTSRGDRMTHAACNRARRSH